MIRTKELNLALLLIDEFKISDTKYLTEIVNTIILSAEIICRCKMKRDISEEELRQVKQLSDNIEHIVTNKLNTEYYNEFYSSVPIAFGFKVSKKNSNYLNGECKYGIGL
jgi:hypothetical protein